MRSFLFWSSLWLGVSGSGLDQSLTSKKTVEQKEENKQRESKIKEAVKTVETAVKDAAAAVVAPVTVRSTCIATVCSWKDQATILESVSLPKWYTSLPDPLGSRFLTSDRYRYARSAEDVPVWTLHDAPEFCFQVEQAGGRSMYSSYFKNIPANRRYMLLFGSASYPDEDMDDHIANHEDVCKGNIQIEYKYLIDLWKTGDDFTKYPEAPRGAAYIDDRPYTHRRSVVNYREGAREFEGELLYYIYRLKHNRAWWITDATLLEFAADANTANTTDISQWDLLNTAVYATPVNGFWTVMSDADHMEDIMDEQKIRLFGRADKGGARGRLAPSRVNSAVALWQDQTDGPDGQKLSLETKFAYNQQVFVLPIVACGLFDKAFPAPKLCKGRNGIKPEGVAKEG